MSYSTWNFMATSFLLVSTRANRCIGIAAKTLPIAAAVAVLSSCTGYVPGTKVYWDEQIQSMCEKDGHVHIIETVQLSRAQSDSMPRSEGMIALRVQLTKPIEDPVYAQLLKTTSLRERNPEVQRKEMAAIRRSDRKVVATWAQYSRVGGDPSTGIAHETAFLCPDSHQVLAELQSLFVIKE